MFSIPELDEVISQHLSPVDLARCVQVNKQWFKAVIPFLWQDLSKLRSENLFKLVAQDYNFTHPSPDTTFNDPHTHQDLDSEHQYDDDDSDAYTDIDDDEEYEDEDEDIEESQLRPENSEDDATRSLAIPAWTGVGPPPLTKYGHLVKTLPDPNKIIEAFDLRYMNHPIIIILVLCDMDTTEADEKIRSIEPTTEHLLRHLLQVRCPQALRFQTQLFIANEMTHPETVNLLADCAPYAKEIAFRYTVEMRARDFGYILDQCSDKLEHLSVQVVFKGTEQPHWLKEEDAEEWEDPFGEPFDGYDSWESSSGHENEDESESDDDKNPDKERPCPSRALQPTKFPFKLKTLSFLEYQGCRPVAWLWKLLAPTCTELTHLQICAANELPYLVASDLARPGFFPRLESIRFGGVYVRDTWDSIRDSDCANILKSRPDPCKVIDPAATSTSATSMSSSADTAYQAYEGGDVNNDPLERQGWRHVFVTDTANFGHEAQKALKISAPNLESFTFEGQRDERVDQVDQVLIDVIASQPRLKKFSVPDKKGSGDWDSMSQQTIDAKTFIDYREPLASSKMPRVWPCVATLTVLHIAISGIPRPDLEEGDVRQRQGSASLWIEESTPGQGRTLQRQVYERLGTLVNLERLWLGVDPASEWDSVWSVEPRQDGLAMSLESGVEALVGLSKLEELNVTMTQHRIGVEEVQWMTKSWPRLRRIMGLDTLPKPKNKRCGRGQDKEAVKKSNVAASSSSAKTTVSRPQLESILWIQANCPQIHID
ncbi:hypothetical protein BGZ83_000826 [Gryganskiella cystojenkinii]|nr:hypothetical protein BGZ83_000826 [Gryganskiella cystojenkinii]